MTRIGFTGAGTMGAPMVRALVAAGHTVTVWGRTPEKRAALRATGAHVTDKLEQIAAQEVVLGCLLDAPAIEQVYLDGMLRYAREGQVFADHGTYAPRVAVAVARAYAERGAYFLDAPVSGGPMGVEERTLVCMVGGDAAAVGQLRCVASAYTGRLGHLGGPGRGLALKLVNNFLVSINFVATAEAAWLIEHLGLDGEVSHEILSGGLADSAVLRRTLLKALHHDHDAEGMSLGGLVEVQRNIADLLTETGFDSGMFPYARGVFAAAADTAFSRHPSALTGWLPGAHTDQTHESAL